MIASSSTTGQTVSVLRSTSFLRGCNPIEESKQASLKGTFCASMGEPQRENRDWKFRQPRIYPEYSYPSPTPNRSAAQSSQPPTIARSNSMMAVSQRTEEVKGEEEDVETREQEGMRTNVHNSEPPILRKRKLSWPPRHVGDFEVEQQQQHRDGVHEKSGDVQMKPLVTSTGMVATMTNERLPGIAHLDEQMNTPWSADHARRSAQHRESVGEDSLRRLSSHSYIQGGRSWRSSIGGDHTPFSSHSPRLSVESLRRPTSPIHPSYDSEHRQLHHYHIYPDRLSPRGSPSMQSGAPAFPRRSPFEGERATSYRGEDLYASRANSTNHPNEERRMFHSGLLSQERRDESYRQSPTKQVRRNLESGGSEYSPYRYSSSHHHNNHHHQQQQQQQCEPHTSGGEQQQQYGHRLYDRDSPSFYEETGSQRLEESSPRIGHSFSSSGGVTTSPTVPRRRGKLPKVVTDLLKSWLLDHSTHPYPTEDEKRRLCNVTGLSISQVSNWFINARRRILVPQGSGSFALGHSSSGIPAHSTGPSSPPSPPHPHLATPHHAQHNQQQQQQQHYQQDSFHAPLHHHEDSKPHLYRRSSATTTHHHSRSPPEHLSHRSYDESSR